MMPENENTSPALPLAVPAPGKKSFKQKLWPFIALAALALAGWQWLETRQQLGDARQEASRQLGEVVTESQAAQKLLREQLAALQTRLGAVEEKQGEFQGLQSLYQDIARSREEATLLEVEQALTLAAQQLQLAGNVPVAILALQTADARLARLDRPAYLPLRKAVAKDLERLNAMPFVDVPGLSLRLEQVVLAADKWPLASLGRPAVATEPLAPEGQAWWQRTTGNIWRELKGLVRIQRFDSQAPVLLAPGQEFFLRENIKLRLLNARLALLAHDQATFRGELKAAQDGLGRHFDGADKAVQTAAASLRQMSGTDLNVELPTLHDSQTALRALRNPKEKR
ncbi:MAG: uroporphyrinogen-III C-methyltransferase [Azonexus sp.]